MRRADFEHVIAAAASVTHEDHFVVIGSQAIHGTPIEPPTEMLMSLEADLYPRDAPEKAILVDGSLGDGSPFQAQFGFYAHGVGPETAKAPAGWQERLLRVDIPPRIGSPRRPVAWCLEPHDLVLSKCAASRERDWTFAGAAITAGIVDTDRLLELVSTLPIPDAHRQHIRGQLLALAERPPG